MGGWGVLHAERATPYGGNRDMSTPAMIFSTFGLYRILIYRIFAIGPWSLEDSKLLPSYTQPSTTMAYLEVDHVTKRYSEHTALNEVSLSAHEGRIFGLLGPNGAGKSSLIRIINRITAPDSGEVRLEGHPLREEDLFHIGYLPEERGLYPKMKVGEQAIYLARLKGLSKSDAQQRVKEWFERLEITSWWDKRVEELSKGMQQKVQFVTTVVHEPRLLIFDEPFSGFDPVNAEVLKREILALKAKGTTLMLSTHNMQSVEELCDDITLINRAEVVLSGQTAREYAEHTALIPHVSSMRERSPLPTYLI